MGYNQHQYSMKDVKYLNKSFEEFKQSLQDFAKVYFPNTNNDFTDSSPATMITEMAAYVGDVLSLYTDRTAQEFFLDTALSKDSLISLAYTLGYRPKVTSTATVTLDVYQQIPAKVEAGIASPDYSYALTIEKEAKINAKSNRNVTFITQAPVNFSFSSSYDPTEVSVYSLNGSQPEYYLLKKSVKAIAGSLKEQSFTFTDPVKFNQISLQDTNIIKILSATDSDGNVWFEVPYLAQSTVFEQVPNTTTNYPTLSQYNDSVPYILKLKKVQRRFVTRFTPDNTMTIEFGAGVSSEPDEAIIPNANNVGLGLVDGLSKLTTSFDPANFLMTKEYGAVPTNTTITFKYIVGGGVETNVPADDVQDIYELTTNSNSVNPSALNQALLQSITNTVRFNNSTAASGGGDGDSVEDLRLKTQANYPTQLRNVSPDDFVVRALSLPSEFGTVAKAANIKDFAKDSNDNPLAVSLYVLSFDNNKKLTQASLALKENLKTYLSQYDMATDGVSIKDAYYINIGINFEIIVLPSYNNREVLSECLESLKNRFDIDKWTINQPIIVADIYNDLNSIKGVQNVTSVEVVNKQGEAQGYSRYGYDLKGAYRNGVYYPSITPMIFECRFPQSDIQGRVKQL